MSWFMACIAVAALLLRPQTSSIGIFFSKSKRKYWRHPVVSKQINVQNQIIGPATQFKPLNMQLIAIAAMR